MNKFNNDFDKKELKIADKVADELLIKKREHVLIWLFLLVLVFLCAFFPSLIFSSNSANLYLPYISIPYLVVS